MAGLSDARRKRGALSPVIKKNDAPYTQEDIDAEAAAMYGDFAGGLAGAARGMYGSSKAYLGAGLDAAGFEDTAAGLRESALRDRLRSEAIGPGVSSLSQIDDGESASRYLAGMTGSAAGSIPPALAGGVTGRALTRSTAGAVGGAAVAYQPTMAGQMVQEIEANPNTAGMEAGDKFAYATGAGSAQAALEGLGPGYLASRLMTRAPAATSFKGALKDAGKTVGINSALEGAGAAGSDVIGQGAMMNLDPTLEYDPMRTLDQGVGEAIGSVGVSAPGAAVASGLDYAAAGADAGKRATKAGVRAGEAGAPKVASAAKAAGQDVADAAALFTNTAAGYLKHPELAKLVADQALPPEMQNASQGEIVDWLAQDDGERRNAAINIAKRTLVDRDATLEQKQLAQALIDNPADPEAWKPFADSVVAKQRLDRLGIKIGRAGSQLRGWVDGLGKQKSNLEGFDEVTAEFDSVMQEPLASALGTTNQQSLADASALLRDYVLSDFAADAKGNPRVPDGLVDAMGENAPQLLAQAYDTLRRQGLTKKMDATAKARLEAVGKQVGERLNRTKDAAAVVERYLTPTRLRQIAKADLPDLADGIRAYLNTGGTDKVVEHTLYQLFGANTEEALEALKALDPKVSQTRYESEEDAAKVDTDPGEEDASSDKAVDEFDRTINEVEGGSDYHFKSAKEDARVPFDREDAYLADNLQRAKDRLGPEVASQIVDPDTLKTAPYTQEVGVARYARETGDDKLLNELQEKYPDMSEKELDRRFFVLKTERNAVDNRDELDIDPRELRRPATKKGKPNKASWKDVTEFAGRDVSTIEYGRLYLTSVNDLADPVFATSAQKIITKMWGRGHTTDGTPQGMLKAFASGLTSLLNTGEFDGEIRVKLPSGSLVLVDSIDSLPDNFVLFRSAGDKAVTLKDALGTTSPQVRMKKFTGRRWPKKEGAPKRLVDRFEVSDIPTMTLSELREAGEALMTALENPRLTEESRDGIVAKLQAFRKAYREREGLVKVGEKEVAPGARGGKETAGLIGERVVERGEGSFKWSEKEGRVVEEAGKMRGARAHHGISETEEMSATKQAEYDAAERRFDEETGLELHPKERFGADQRVKQLDAKVAELRRQYAQLADQVKALGEMPNNNAVRAGKIRKLRGEMARVVEKGKELGAKREALVETLVRLDKKSEQFDRKQKVQDKINAARTGVVKKEISERKALGVRLEMARQALQRSDEREGTPDADTPAHRTALQRRVERLEAALGVEQTETKPAPGEVDVDSLDPRTPVWAVHAPRDETETGKLLKVFKDLGKAQAYAEEVGGNLAQDMAGNLQSKELTSTEKIEAQMLLSNPEAIKDYLDDPSPLVSIPAQKVADAKEALDYHKAGPYGHKDKVLIRRLEGQLRDAVDELMLGQRMVGKMGAVDLNDTAELYEPRPAKADHTLLPSSVNDVIRDGANLQQTLRALKGSGALSSQQAKYVDYLLGTNVGEKVSVMFSTPLSPGQLGLYSRRLDAGGVQRTIRLMAERGGATVETLLHEATHVVTAMALRVPTPEQKPFVAFMERLVSFVQKKRAAMLADGTFSKADAAVTSYGMLNTDEFLAEFMGRPGFRKALEKIRISSKQAEEMFRAAATSVVASRVLQQDLNLKDESDAREVTEKTVVALITKMQKRAKETGEELGSIIAAVIHEMIEAPARVTGEYNYNLEAPGSTQLTDEQKAEVSAYVEKTLGPKVAVAFTDALKGSGEWSRDKNNQNAAIRVSLTAANPLSVAHHEAMHEFFQRLLDGKFENAAETLRQAASSPLVMRQLERHFAGQKAVLKQINNDVEERIAYMFQLWASGKLSVGPKTETVFQKIVKAMRRAVGMLTADQRAEDILRAFHDGRVSEPGALAEVLNTQEARGAYMRRLGKTLDPVLKRANEWVGFAESALLDTGNPGLEWLGRQMHNKTGSRDTEQGYLSAKEQQSNAWLNKFAQALRGTDPNGKDTRIATKEDIDIALELMQKKEWSQDPVIRRVQRQVKAVFKEMHGYATDAGVMRFDEKSGDWVPLGKIEDYWLPRSWDADKIITNSERFKQLLHEHHEDALADIAEKANKEVAEGRKAKASRKAKKGAGEYTASWEKLRSGDKAEVTTEDVANAIVNRVISANGQVDLSEDPTALGFSQFARSVNKRSLKWIDDSVFAEFQEKDMSKILSSYVYQMTKRAEYSRRFGADGIEIEKKMTEAWQFEVARIVEQRYGVKDVSKKATEAILASMANGDEPLSWSEEVARLAGVDEAAIDAVRKDALMNLEPARRAMMAMEGSLGSDISPTMRKASAYMIVYQNVRLLGYSAFANVIDPMGIIVRGGEFKDAYAAFKRGMREVFREWGDLTGVRKAKESDRDEAVRLAEMVGTIDSSGFMSQMGLMYGSQYMTDRARRINETFFRWNGTEALNRAARVQATQAAVGFIKRHYEKPNEHSQRYFEELGLTRDDVEIDQDGALNVENKVVQRAIMRWVDGAILRPNAAMRPTMASDPHYAVFYHLKQFMYAMHSVILKRAYHEIKHGNNSPLLTLLAGYVPVMLAADTAKGLIQEAAGGGAPLWQHDGVSGVVAHGVQRAGLLGIAQIPVDAATYGPSGVFGPAVEQVAGAVTDPLMKTAASAVAIGPANMMLKGTTWE